MVCPGNESSLVERKVIPLCIFVKPVISFVAISNSNSSSVLTTKIVLLSTIPLIIECVPPNTSLTLTDFTSVVLLPALP